MAVRPRLGSMAPRPRVVDADLRRGVRRAVRRRGPLAAFFAFGLFWGGWAALVPAVQAAVGASKGELGLALLFVAVGSVPAMLLTGRELDRRGTRILPLLLAAFAAATVLPAFVGSVA